MGIFALCFGVVALFAFTGSSDVQATASVGIVPEWTFTPRLRIVDASGSEIPSPMNIRDEDRSVDINLSIEVKETLGVLPSDLSQKLDGHMGIGSLGGAIYFADTSREAGVQRSVGLDVSTMVSEIVDSLGPKDGFYSNGFIKFLSAPEGARWLLVWLTAPIDIAYLRGAWCLPEEFQHPGERGCEVSLGNIQVPVSHIPPGVSVSVKVGGSRVEQEPVVIKALPYIDNEYVLRPIVAEGNTVILRVPL